MAYAEKVFKVRNGKQTKQFSWKSKYKKPDGTWGTESGFSTKAAALDFGGEQEAAVRRGNWIDPKLQRQHFGVFVRKTWMPAKAKRGNTVDRRWNNLDGHIFPRWEHVALNAITWFDVDAWQQTLTCDDVTRGHCVSLMSTILTGAVDAQHLLVNPLYGRRRTQATAAAARPKKSQEDKWAPVEVVLRVADRMGPVNGLHVLTTAFTGLGWGEGAALHRDNTLLRRRQAHDGGWFECPVIRVDSQVGTLAEYTRRGPEGERLGGVLQLEPPKNDEARPRDIDIPPFLEQLLRYHLADWPHAYVFSTPKGKFWRRGNFGRAQLRPAADGRPRLPRVKGHAARPAWSPVMMGLTMRDLRHTHDTYQDQIGVKASLAYEQAGHLRPGIKRVYQHPTPAMRVERLAGLEELYERGMRNLGWTALWGRVSLTKKSRASDLPNIPQTIFVASAPAA
ncbi:hypothetical protein [Streptomyces sp. TBY4]|uniref:hypothetical protein n=1 Tax=Streptomyces sp. TBY4 TaxID=2962030 RepID=UPI0020B89C72|nr:hypothetical protein [Streptomyces sp. TBY4]MCP3758174.1 hypothetical protein [Streptomyces sp. TBY4]